MLFAAMLMTGGCAGGSQKQAGQDSGLDSTVVDSDSVKVDSTVSEKPAEVVVDKELRADLVTFDLYGKVKSCEFGDVTVTFTEDGKLATYNGKAVSKAFASVKRDGKGRITKLVTDPTEDFGLQYTYGSNGRVATYTENLYYSGNPNSELRYDADGTCVGETTVTGDEEGETNEKATFSAVKTDDHGNWTSRTAKYVIKQTEWDGSDDGSTTTSTNTVYQVRHISYYE